MTKKQKLELTWVGKDNRPRLEPRILIEDPSKSYHAAKRVSDTDIFDNVLIHGDNLLALKALEADYAGKVKCVFIDPPYNTGSAFEHYDDGLEHSIWLGLMRDRLEIIRRLLTEDGTLWITIDDNEAHYLKVLCDEIFGRNNFINQISMKMKLTAGASGGGEDKKLKKNIEYALVYCKNNDSTNGFKKFNDVYDEYDLFEVIEEMEDEGKSWKYTSVLVSKGELHSTSQIKDGAGEPLTVRRYRGVQRTTVKKLTKSGLDEAQVYVDKFENIFSDTNAQTSIRQRVIDHVGQLSDDELVEVEYTPRSGREKGILARHYYISPTVRRVIWLRDTARKVGRRIVKMEKAGTFWQGFPLNNLTKEGGVQFPNGKKPEALLQKILQLATSPGDVVLDSFAGSGTTGAVAHKMGRRWIMVELGDHCTTHIIPRMQRVIDREDQGGISKAVEWTGGGGFRYFELAPSLLTKDKWGREVVSGEYNAEMLAQAVCKLEGFAYDPSPEVYWQQGRSSESDFIYVTTQTLSTEELATLSSEVGDDRTLMILCSAWRSNADQWPNLTLRKIPNHIRNKCEWGHDDYSLNVANLPMAEQEPVAVPAQAGLFDGGNEA
jgi:adenine-specific DNA-methyltransferase